MKKVLLFLAIFALNTVMTHAQKSDVQQVETTLNYYLDGGTNNEFETLQKAFHPTATMKSISDEGDYREVNAIDFFKKHMKPGPKQDRKTRIVSMDITGTIASAVLEIDFGTGIITDHMSLLKVDGEWKIVNKMFSVKKL